MASIWVFVVKLRKSVRNWHVEWNLVKETITWRFWPIKFLSDNFFFADKNTIGLFWIWPIVVSESIHKAGKVANQKMTIVARAKLTANKCLLSRPRGVVNLTLNRRNSVTLVSLPEIVYPIAKFFGRLSPWLPGTYLHKKKLNR